MPTIKVTLDDLVTLVSLALRSHVESVSLPDCALDAILDTVRRHRRKEVLLAEVPPQMRWQHLLR